MEQERDLPAQAAAGDSKKPDSLACYPVSPEMQARLDALTLHNQRERQWKRIEQAKEAVQIARGMEIRSRAQARHKAFLLVKQGGPAAADPDVIAAAKRPLFDNAVPYLLARP
ncbi:hypothetical protein JIN84_05525 [Luteolibacter yonseiensis]|uniref:Uncharacterized protein n=1 Tax=Luteolibacter yonseiensis TaxID=1144680 RepID=A0A934VAE1_9BACT|nr:hypothetical protein [Luteolibacter yonseiensis]MBK1815060.1 hypothetical protein [Luteolibacter yonseiensis]